VETDTQEFTTAAPSSAPTTNADKRNTAQGRSHAAQPRRVAVPARRIHAPVHLPHRVRENAGVNVSRGERVASSALGALLLAAGASRRSVGAAATGLFGAALLYRGLSGHCHVYQALRLSSADDAKTTAVQSQDEMASVKRTVTIERSAQELYDLWREPQNVQKIMEFFAQTRSAADGGTQWTIRTPIGKVFECDTRIVQDLRGERLQWESGANSAFRNSGSIRFAQARGNRGTLVTLELILEPSGGRLARGAARILRIVPDTIALKVLQRFKNLAETGEIATATGGPSGREQESHALVQAVQATSWRDGLAQGLGCFSVGLGVAELLAPSALARVIGLPDRPALMRAFGLRELMSGIGILSQRRREFWLWSRVAGDAMDLTLLGSALGSPHAQPDRLAAATAAVVGVTVLDVVSARQEHTASDTKEEIARGMSQR